MNKLARDKTNAEMVNRVNQQNPSLREFRQENRELKATLEDHQRALEIIMHKYREQIQHKVFTSRINFKEMYNVKLQEVIRKQQEKINEMAAVMQKAASIDDDIINNEIELITKLKVENQGLREMLQISQQFGTQRIDCEDKAVQTEINEFISKIENGSNDNSLSKEPSANDATNFEKDQNNELLLIKKSTTTSVATMITTTTTIATATTPTTSISNTSSVVEPITSTIKTTNQCNMKDSKNVESEPKDLTTVTTTLVDLATLTSSIPIVNGESDECKIQDQVS